MRKWDKKRYVMAFIITTAIFCLGFFAGFVMDLQRINYFETLNEVHKMNIRSLQLQYELAKTETLENRCGAFKYMFDKFILELENNRERLELYAKQAKLNKDDFQLLQREYVISQINFWYIAENLKTSCSNESDFVTVIFFYSDKKKCPDCENQAIVLDYYKLNLKQSILIFAIDEQFDQQEPLISLLKTSYMAKEYPTLVIDNKVYSGMVDKEEMRELLCDRFKTEENRNIICNTNQT